MRQISAPSQPFGGLFSRGSQVCGKGKEWARQGLGEPVACDEGPVIHPARGGPPGIAAAAAPRGRRQIPAPRPVKGAKVLEAPAAGAGGRPRQQQQQQENRSNVAAPRAWLSVKGRGAGVVGTRIRR